MKRSIYFFAAAAAFAAAVLLSDTAADGVKAGLSLCAGSLIPSLFPLFVLAKLIQGLGFPPRLEKSAGRLMYKIFGMPPCAAEALLLGLCGGYPLGAHTVAALRQERRITKQQAETLLAFCNNSGPAFILGAAGAALHSFAAGAVLYFAHVTAALTAGWLFCRRFRGSAAYSPPPEKPERGDLKQSFTSAVSSSAQACISISAYVCFFSAVSAFSGDFGTLPPAARVLARGILELGSGIGALNGLTPQPLTMAAAGFILGWGGISVHLQTLSAVADTDISCARHLAGRALCGLIAAFISFCMAFILVLL